MTEAEYRGAMEKYEGFLKTELARAEANLSEGEPDAADHERIGQIWMAREALRAFREAFGLKETIGEMLRKEVAWRREC